MRILFAYLITFLVGFSAYGQNTLSGKVISVSDGDTFTMLTQGNRQVKIRLHGIDCPEKRQDFGTVAKNYTSGQIFGKIVQARVLKQDQYRRSVAIVILPNGKNLNQELLRAGMAWHYKKYDKSSEFALLEKQARINKAGLWKGKSPMPPWEFRKLRRNIKTGNLRFREKGANQLPGTDLF